jgi:hypothetical protein
MYDAPSCTLVPYRNHSCNIYLQESRLHSLCYRDGANDVNADRNFTLFSRQAVTALIMPYLQPKITHPPQKRGYYYTRSDVRARSTSVKVVISIFASRLRWSVLVQAEFQTDAKVRRPFLAYSWTDKLSQPM